MSRPEAYDPTQAHDGITEQRIEHAAQLMRDCRFVRGKTSKVLAKEWGISEQRTREITAMAHKRVAAEMMHDREAIEAEIGSALSIGIKGAVEREDWRSIAALAKVYADASGVSAPTKLEQIIEVGAATPAELAAVVREQFGEKATPPLTDGSTESVSEGAPDEGDSSA